MAKTLTYEVSLHPAHRTSGGGIMTSYKLFSDYPQKTIQAAGMPDLVAKVAKFATAHGEGCTAMVRCLAPRKPPGFAAATRSLFYNLDKEAA